MAGEVEFKVKLPKDLYEKVKQEAKDSGFSDISQFIQFVLEQLFESGETGGEMTAEDEEKVKERLRALGYID